MGSSASKAHVKPGRVPLHRRKKKRKKVCLCVVFSVTRCRLSAPVQKKQTNKLDLILCAAGEQLCSRTSPPLRPPHGEREANSRTSPPLRSLHGEREANSRLSSHRFSPLMTFFLLTLFKKKKDFFSFHFLSLSLELLLSSLFPPAADGFYSCVCVCVSAVKRAQDRCSARIVNSTTLC